MGLWMSRLLSLFGDREARILVLGLDNAGKTTILCAFVLVWFGLSFPRVWWPRRRSLPHTRWHALSSTPLTQTNTQTAYKSAKSSPPSRVS